MTALDEDECFVTCANGNHVYKEISSVLVSQPLNIARCHCMASELASQPRLAILVCVLRSSGVFLYRS